MPEEVEGASEVDMDLALRELADLSMRYPFRWFPQNKVAILCGFGREVLTVLTALGAPVVARKCNPHLLQKWLEQNVEKIGKMRPG